MLISEQFRTSRFVSVFVVLKFGKHLVGLSPFLSLKESGKNSSDIYLIEAICPDQPRAVVKTRRGRLFSRNKNTEN